jgi:hypothetical protein
MHLNGDREFFINDSYMQFNLKANLIKDVVGRGSFELRALGFPENGVGVNGSVPNASNTLINNNSEYRDVIQPVETRLNEAYVDIYGFIYDNLDISVGKQKIAWGAADQLTQTDNLFPDDLSDILEMGAKLSANSLKLTQYHDDFTLTGIYIPVFSPSLFPKVNMHGMYQNSMGVANPASLNVSYESPPAKFKNSMYGIKASGLMYGFDTSISYFSGYDDLPFMKTTAVTSAGVDITQVYPEVRVVGFDFAGSIDDIGVWGEFASIHPKEIDYTYTMNGSVVSSMKVLTEPYLRYTLGCDYSFKEIYINTQLSHGFFNQRHVPELSQGGELTDVLFIVVEQKLMDEKVLLQVKFGGEFDEFENIGTFFAPEIVYYPTVATQLTFGWFAAEGVQNNDHYAILRQFHDMGLNQVYAKAKYSF